MHLKLFIIFLLVNFDHYSAFPCCLLDYIHEKYFLEKGTALQIPFPEKPMICIFSQKKDYLKGFGSRAYHPKIKDIEVKTILQTPSIHVADDDHETNEHKHTSHLAKISEGSISFTSVLFAIAAVFALIVIIYEWFHMPELHTLNDTLDEIAMLIESPNEVTQMPYDREHDTELNESVSQIPLETALISENEVSQTPYDSDSDTEDIERASEIPSDVISISENEVPHTLYDSERDTEDIERASEIPSDVASISENEVPQVSYDSERDTENIESASEIPSAVASTSENETPQTPNDSERDTEHIESAPKTPSEVESISENEVSQMPYDSERHTEHIESVQEIPSEVAAISENEVPHMPNEHNESASEIPSEVASISENEVPQMSYDSERDTEHIGSAPEITSEVASILENEVPNMSNEHNESTSEIPSLVASISENEVPQMPVEHNESASEIPSEVASISEFGNITSSEAIFNYLQDITNNLEQSDTEEVELYLTTEFLNKIADYIYENYSTMDYLELFTPDYLFKIGKLNHRYTSQLSGGDNQVNVQVVVNVTEV